MFESSLIDVMSLDITEETYYGYTPKQLNNTIRAKQKARENSLKNKAVLDYKQAYTIALMVNMSLCGKSNFPAVEEIYGLWTDDEIAEKNDVESAENFKRFARLFNSQFNTKE